MLTLAPFIGVEVLGYVLTDIQPTLNIWNTDISEHLIMPKRIVWTHFLISLHFNSCYLKRLVSRNKFSGTILPSSYRELTYLLFFITHSSHPVKDKYTFPQVPVGVSLNICIFVFNYVTDIRNQH